MNSQKVKNKKIIGFITGILTILLGILGITILIYIGIFVTSQFSSNLNPINPVIDVPIKISEKSSIEFLNGSFEEITVDRASISFNYNKKFGIIAISNFLFIIIFLLISFYVVFLLWKIFMSIKRSLKEENLFLIKNVWRIRYIAFAIFCSAILNIFYPLILKYFWFNNITMLDKTFSIRLNFDAAENIIWALIILVVAEIYRIGLEIKKDQELTI